MFLEKRDPWEGGYHNDRSQRDFPCHTASTGASVKDTRENKKRAIFQVAQQDEWGSI